MVAVLSFLCLLRFETRQEVNFEFVSVVVRVIFGPQSVQQGFEPHAQELQFKNRLGFEPMRCRCILKNRFIFTPPLVRIEEPMPLPNVPNSLSKRRGQHRNSIRASSSSHVIAKLHILLDAGIAGALMTVTYGRTVRLGQ